MKYINIAKVRDHTSDLNVQLERLLEAKRETDAPSQEIDEAIISVRTELRVFLHLEHCFEDSVRG